MFCCRAHVGGGLAFSVQMFLCCKCDYFALSKSFFDLSD